MALEASIVERLEELRKWQMDQEERLLMQQQEQRELLNIEQERIYEALGLSMKGIIIDETIIDQTSVSKIKDRTNTIQKNSTNNDIINNELEITPKITKQQCAISKNSSSPNSWDSRNQSNIHLNVPDLCLKTFDTDLTLSDASNYRDLPQYELVVEKNNQEVDETPKRFHKAHIGTCVDGVEPLVPDKLSRKCMLIDELPVPSPKKDFKTLLEEKLRDDEMMTDKIPSKNIVKKPFLRKGEGLARFHSNSTTNKVVKQLRPRNASRCTNSSNTKIQKINTKDVVEKSKMICRSKKVNHVTRRSMNDIPNVAQQKLILSNVPMPKKNVRNSRSLPSSITALPSSSKSDQIIDKYISNDESNQSDLDSSKLETKMFEMLEEKAENSSFCSTSSAVIAFMQQSTPLKLKSIRTNLPLSRKLKKDSISDEVVHTEKVDILPQSPVMHLHETYAQKDIVMSRSNSNLVTDENVPQIHTRNSSKKSIKIVEPLNKKSNQLQQNHDEIVKVTHTALENDSFISCSINNNESVHEINHDKEPVDLLDNEPSGPERKTETNVSMHVRFAEYNEYKTIGLTDTSTLSTDSHSVAIYDSEKNWRDHLGNKESSDCEMILPSRDEIINEKLIGIAKNQDDYINANCIITNRKAIIARESQNDSENSDTNSIDQSTDDENSIFHDSNETCYDENTTISGIQEAIAKVLRQKDEDIDITPTDTLKSTAQSKICESNDTIFKSDLLKNRLLELEREIHIFRKENAALSSQRQKIQEQYRQMQRELKEKELNLEHERIQMTNTFKEEKKRLAREKSALENRLCDAREKSIQSKHEREEIQMLKEQLHDLKEDMAEKESRWQATQARQRSQTRVLQMENSKLKSEIERLQAIKRTNGKLKRPTVITNTKAIHQINKQLDGKRGTKSNHTSISDGELEKAEFIQKKNSQITVSSASSTTTKRISASNNNNNTDKISSYDSSITQKTLVKPTEESISKKRHLYESLLKDASISYHERTCENSSNIPGNNATKSNKSPSKCSSNIVESNIFMEKYGSKEDSNLSLKPVCMERKFTMTINDGGSKQRDEKEKIMPLNDNSNSELVIHGSYDQFVREVINPRSEKNQLSYSSSDDIIDIHKSSDSRHIYQQINYASHNIKSTNDQVQTTFSSPRLINEHNEKPNQSSKSENVQLTRNKINYGNDGMKLIFPSDMDLTPRPEHQKPLPRPPDSMTPHPEHIQVSQISDSSNQNKMNITSPGSSKIREVKHQDGHTEYWYPNGNVKRIYPDRNVTKMIYYNGDVRETLSDGCVKYFYAATKTWHTTYPDGFEILEFPDGQEERRTKDGVVEVSFPDGSIRLMQPDGIEKWALLDGTIAEIFPNGEKILSLPNGQREIHTVDHKRREYLDGTVKFVYPDGTQETRYSNGRIRIKDKDGNLVMDSHQV